ncbi:hypothetical protein CAPTEDRAFT_143582 [Capitella teleta]|uniref:Capsule synthesis protein CapA domain-containing protein n=1 Tax=Capitella teleta TaxID=283909 RepID=R7U9M8_CAPTE|nr:hypothetical protein CAPTEDRAFT_143582 [Capitella teleta]|eukprot:ELT99805.1 hypothetical protein CAPTEDRAFT_143582 [Capitella teleta]
MLARGIDMIQEHSCDPKIYEGNGLNAHGYVQLAEAANGPLPHKNDRGPDYVWGDALSVLKSRQPDLRLINLETSVTTSMTPWPTKAIHYKMHPNNVNILKAAEIDCCILSNNHTADWGLHSLKDTMCTLNNTSILYAGAGFNENEAVRPAVFSLPGKGRVLVFGVGHISSGVPDKWRAGETQEGLFMLDVHHPIRTSKQLRSIINNFREKDDIVVLSIHWGGNWGFNVDEYLTEFAHAAIDDSGVDLVHGHSSHHVKGLEVYKGKLVIYGCGDFINDYEGITGKEQFRGDLSLMYFADLDFRDGKLNTLEMVPMRMKKLRVTHASDADVTWLASTMSRECRRFNCDVQRDGRTLKLLF